MSAQESLSPWQFGTGTMRFNDMSVTASVPYDAGDQASLTSDIARNGITSPISIKREKGQSMIIQGHHRRRGARSLGMESGPVNVKYRGDDVGTTQDLKPISEDEYHKNMSKPSWVER